MRRLPQSRSRPRGTAMSIDESREASYKFAGDARPSAAAQQASVGGSSREIHAAVLAAALPAPGLSWLDVGCGTGDMVAEVLEGHEPTRVVGVDIVDFLADR